MIIKNSNLRRNLFSNRYKILGIIVAIILVFGVIRVLNDMAKENLNLQGSSNNVAVQSSYKPQETVISGGNVSSEQQEINTEVLDNFIKYCNAKDVEKAYGLLTEECKENLFNSKIENFKNNYVEKIFTSNKTYSMQSWIQEVNSSTYQVRLLDDILSTGKIGNTIDDYYTIVKQNGNYKLNINSYIGRTQINKEKTGDNITISVIYKDTYMNYETYKIKAQNNTNNTIILDTKQNSESVYVKGNNNVTYRGFMYEIDDADLTIKPRIYRNLTIKFNKIYNPTVRDNSITFSDIVNDITKYNQTQNNEGTEPVSSQTKITVEL